MDNYPLKLNHKGKATAIRNYHEQLLAQSRLAANHSNFLAQRYKLEINANITDFELSFLEPYKQAVMIFTKICQNNAKHWIIEKSRCFTVPFNNIATILGIKRKAAERIKKKIKDQHYLQSQVTAE
jgi:hypothetical protein